MTEFDQHLLWTDLRISESEAIDILKVASKGSRVSGSERGANSIINGICHVFDSLSKYLLIVYEVKWMCVYMK